MRGLIAPRVVGRAAVLVIFVGLLTGCLVGPRMLPSSERIPEIEGASWCEFSEGTPGYTSGCKAFTWRGGYYTDDRGSRFHFLRLKTNARLVIGEYGKPDDSRWGKMSFELIGPRNWIVTSAHKRDDYSDFDQLTRKWDLAVERKDDGTTSLTGMPENMLKFMMDAAGKVDTGTKYFRIDDTLKVPHQVAHAAKGAGVEHKLMAERLCRSAVANGNDKENRDWQKILDLLEACDILVRELPAQALYWRARANQGQSNFDKAYADYTKVLASSEIDKRAHPQIYFDRGKVSFSLERYGDAVQDYSAAILGKPDFYKAYNSRGVAYRRMQNYPAAVEDYTQAINLSAKAGDTEEQAWALMRRGYVHLLEERLGPAEKDAKQALALDGSLSYAYSNLGQINEMQNRPDRARDRYNQALAQWSGNPHATEGLKRLQSGNLLKPKKAAVRKPESTNPLPAPAPKVSALPAEVRADILLAKLEKQVAAKQPARAAETLNALTPLGQATGYEPYFKAAEILNRGGYKESARKALDSYLAGAGKKGAQYDKAIRMYVDLGG